MIRWIFQWLNYAINMYCNGVHQNLWFQCGWYVYFFRKLRYMLNLHSRDPKHGTCWQFTQIDYLPIASLVVHARFRPSLGVLRQAFVPALWWVHCKTHLPGPLLFFARANPFVNAQYWRRAYIPYFPSFNYLVILKFRANICSAEKFISMGALIPFIPKP